jgi:hypothetical protein
VWQLSEPAVSEKSIAMLGDETMSDQTDQSDTTDDKGANTKSRSSKRAPRNGLSRELLHGLTPDEFKAEAHSLAEAEAMTPQVRERMKAHLVERLMTPVDRPSWGPDWIRQSDRDAPRRGKKKSGGLMGFFRPERNAYNASETTEPPVKSGLSSQDNDESRVIARNLETSRQVAHYSGLYVFGMLIAIAIALLAMFVDYSIIRGDIWTRALSNEFMVVPASLQSSVVFKSLQVVFAVLIVHFMLKITGVYGRNAMITTGFVLALVMIGCLGYLVAYNNMEGGTSATLEHHEDGGAPAQDNSINKLFASLNAPNDTSSSTDAQTDSAISHSAHAGMQNADETLSPSVPKISQRSLANADSWLWLAFASVIFFIVTMVAALYLQTSENNARNFMISRDYKHRRRMFAQLHLLELADRKQNGQAA